MGDRRKATLRWERLASAVRFLQASQTELRKELGVLNRRVELIHDQQEADAFLEEEDPADNAT